MSEFERNIFLGFAYGWLVGTCVGNLMMPVENMVVLAVIIIGDLFALGIIYTLEELR